ncbi:type II toxin-antitoxin system HicA family toxin [Floridanema aerugineum]|uniref:Type II toxin-antitoxin system HicA family toxin n=1 Tax=Floridaenema aerugineum BLCC-F46 TaxID=3153654 RepID=A0ABV4XCZ2_9CYAN
MTNFLKPQLDRISGAKVVSSLKRLGFTEVDSEENHVLLTRWTRKGKVGCVVLLHPELTSVTLRRILKQAEVTWEEFRENLEL